MAFKGTEKEFKSHDKYVGLFMAEVVAVNPNKDELEKLLGSTLDKDPEYTGSNDETGAKRVTLSFWLKEEKTGKLFNTRFSLEDTVVVSKSGKTQYIDNIGSTTYAESENNFPEFFKESGRPYRKAKKGEELLYNFLRKWLNDLNYTDSNTELMLDDWKGLMNGKVKEIREVIERYSNKTIGALATIRTSNDGKEYQSVYSYDFVPSYAVESYLNGGKAYPVMNRFITKVTDPQYGCVDYYELKALSVYDPTNNVVASSNSPILNKETQAASHDDDLPF